jgi:hypothetical protein
MSSEQKKSVEQWKRQMPEYDQVKKANKRLPPINLGPQRAISMNSSIISLQKTVCLIPWTLILPSMHLA